MRITNNTSKYLFTIPDRNADFGILSDLWNWNKRIWIRAWATLRVWAKRSNQRGELRRIMGHDDHFLRDIGLPRSTLHFEARKWFWEA